MQEMFDAGHALSLIERERVTEPHMFAHQARPLEEHPHGRRPTSPRAPRCSASRSSPATPPSPAIRAGTCPSATACPRRRRSSPAHPAMPLVTCSATAATAVSCPATSSGSSTPDSGRVLGAGEEGELIVRGPTLMEHHVKRTRAECFDADGFYHTGDLGSFDDDGFVYFGGRRTEMIKTGGRQRVAGRDRGPAPGPPRRQARPGGRRPRRPPRRDRGPLRRD